MCIQITISITYKYTPLIFSMNLTLFLMKYIDFLFIYCTIKTDIFWVEIMKNSRAIKLYNQEY